MISAVAITGIIAARGAIGSDANLNIERAGDKVRNNTLTVTGTGKIRVKPDVAYLEVGGQDAR